MDLVEKARVFATAVHAAIGQRRKYSDEDYIVHPAEVVELVRAVGGTPEMLAAAWLHDTVEDTKGRITLDLIAAEFGSVVAEYVENLTDVSRPTDGNRRVRKAIDQQHTARARPEAKTIKLADIIANSGSIIAHDPGFAQVYMREQHALLRVLAEGDPTLHARAKRIVDGYLAGEEG